MNKPRMTLIKDSAEERMLTELACELDTPTFYVDNWGMWARADEMAAFRARLQSTSKGDQQ